MAVKLLSGVGSALDLGRDGEPQGGQLPHLPQQSHQPVAIVHPQLPVLLAQPHQSATGLEAGGRGVCSSRCDILRSVYMYIIYVHAFTNQSQCLLRNENQKNTDEMLPQL